jgi:hypothetical protein
MSMIQGLFAQVLKGKRFEIAEIYIQCIAGFKKNSKSQAPNCKQAPNSNDQMSQTKKRNKKGLSFRILGFGILFCLVTRYLSLVTSSPQRRVHSTQSLFLTKPSHFHILHA